MRRSSGHSLRLCQHETLHRAEGGAGVSIEAILALAVGILILMAIVRMVVGAGGPMEQTRDALVALIQGEELPGGGGSSSPEYSSGVWDPSPESGSDSSYVVPGMMAARDQLAQGHTNLCWAYSYAMLESWRRQQSLEVRQLIEGVGSAWLQRYDNNRGLPWVQGKEFYNAAGLTTEPLQCFPVSHWTELLRNHGPLLLDTLNNSFQGGHARVLYGVEGDGTPSGTRMLILDPWKGADYRESYEDFIAKYDGVAYQEPIRTAVIAHY